MIITKEGFWKLEEGEYQISSNSIVSTLLAYWQVAKKYSLDDLRKQGFSSYPAVEEFEDSVTPRELFNYVYVSEIVRNGKENPPSYYWYTQAEGKLEDWEKSGRKKEWKLYRMHMALKGHGWSPDTEKSEPGSMGRAAKQLGWSRQTVRNLLLKCPEPPEPPFRQRFARMVLDYYYEMHRRIGEFWYWKAKYLLPPEYGTEDYVPRVSLEDFMKHNEGRKELDFALLDEMYEQFSKLKLLFYGGLYQMFVTKGEVRLTDLREPPLQ